MKAFLTLVRLETLSSWRQGGAGMLVVMFYVMTVSLFPFGVGPDPAILSQIGAGIVWVAALLSAILSLDRMFSIDFEDGSMDLLALTAMPLEIQVFANKFLQRGLQHTRFSMDDLKNSADINVLVREAYGWLDRLARDDIQPTASALWDAWDELKIGVGALAPMLARMASLHRELRYAQWNPLSPLPAAWHLAKRLLRR
ncbi:MAG: heme exporter protein CcmB [Proteobacteria bacterium]|nr:heme exporter protein CcmB [Pseudomonadota bacterium]